MGGIISSCDEGRHAGPWTICRRCQEEMEAFLRGESEIMPGATLCRFIEKSWKAGRKRIVSSHRKYKAGDGEQDELQWKVWVLEAGSTLWWLQQ